MSTDNLPPLYRVWGADNISYGPIDLPVLTAWIKQNRVTAHHWIFLDDSNRFVKAAELPELKALFEPGAEAPPAGAAAVQRIKPGSLRRIRIFAEMGDQQLESFLQYLEIVEYRPFGSVVKKGEPGDAMFLILEGELRAFVMIDGKETTLATMKAGEFFGEISLLDQGPRSATVLANADSVVLKFSAESFRHMLREAPALAAPFLYALSRGIVSRVRLLTRKYEDSIHWSRVAHAAK